MAQKTTKYAGAYELIVMANPDAGLRVSGAEAGGFASIAGADVAPLARTLKGVTMMPLFGASEERIATAAAAFAAETGAQVPDLSVFYKIDAEPEKMEELAAKLRDQETIAAAYVKPPAEPAQLQLNDMKPAAEEAPPVSPNFEARQIYLGTAPAGVEALWAHTRPGGLGTNVRIVDVEGAWRFTHEDLLAAQGGVIGGFQAPSLAWRNHGTAVIGVFGGDTNAFGVKGISPNANTRAHSIFTNAAGTTANSANAIRKAADALSAGDIILIELHRPGPDASGVGQDGFIAIEWWEDDFQAIKYATSKGIIVVEAAGNGARNLDAPIFSVRPAGFPASWTNPFNRSNRDSGAVVVGAGAPPPGTHGRDHGPDRSRLAFSNYGALVDAQGWGREVTTCGYGDLQGGANEDVWYTDEFSGTSSASPIVVGAVACLQGIRKASGQPAFTPAQIRSKLRSTGSPQTDAPGRPATQRIGNRPNLRQLLGGVKKIESKEVKNEKIEVKELKNEKAEVKEFKREKIETKEVKELQKEKVEIKEGKPEFEKQFEKQLEKQFEKQGEAGFEGGPGVTGPSLEERVAALEAAMGMQCGGYEAGVASMEAAPALLPLVCTALVGMPLGPRANPLVGAQALFLVRGPRGVPLPASQIVQFTAALRGLNCGLRADITLAVNASQVVLLLGHLSGAGAIRALNAAGVVVAAVPFNPVINVLQAYVLNAPPGQTIRRVVIAAPNDRTVLGRFCFRQFFIGFPDPGSIAALDPYGEQGSHFINEEYRPDLSGGALTGEEDLMNFGGEPTEF